MKLELILEHNNLKGFKNKTFYCGLWKFNDVRSKILKTLGLFKSLFGINKACYIHDKHYNLIFRKCKNIKQLLFYKLIVDCLFLYNMIKYLQENKESKIKKTQRLVLAVIFFVIVVFFTPFYIKLYYKNKKSN